MAQSLMQIIIEAVDKASGTFKNIAGNAAKMGTETGKAGSSTITSFDKATDSVLQYAAGFLTVAAAIKGTRMAWDAAKLGARMESTTLAATNMATGMGASFDDIVGTIQRASLGTVSEFDAIQSASNAMMLGLGADAQKMGNLMEIAALRGRAMGMSTTQAFSDMVRGIGRLSPMILDNLGIVVDAEATFSQYAASIGKTANELTSAEKRQALLNRVLQEGNALLAQSGGLAMDAATAYDRVGAKWADLGNKIKLNFNETILPFITTQKEEVDIYTDEANALLRSGAAYDKYAKAASNAYWKSQAPGARFMKGLLHPLTTDAEAGFIKTFDQYIQAQKDYEKYFAGSRVIMGAVDSQKQLGIAFTELNNEISLQAGLAGKLSDIYTDFDAEMKKAGKSTEKQATAIKNLSEQTGQFLYSLSSGVLEGQVSGQISLAFALGQIDDASFNAALAIDTLGQAYKDGSINLTQYINYIKGVQGALNNLQGKTVTVDIIFNYIGYKTGFDALMGTEGYQNRPRAAGGSVMSGTSYLVGERGPEMFVPNQSGQIIPNNQLGAGKTQVLNFTYAPTISTASQSEIEWALKPAIKKVLREYA